MRQFQQRRNFPVLHASDRMEQHNAPFLITESSQRIQQQNAFICIQAACLCGNGVPFFFTECGCFLFVPQMHKAQVSAHGQQPTNGRPGGPILLCAIPHLYIDILSQILGIVCVFEVRQRKAVHSRFCALIQLCQCFTLPSGNAEKQLLQLELIFRGIFSCHQHTEHGLLSPVIRVMREAGGLLHGLKNFTVSVVSFSEVWNILMYLNNYTTKTLIACAFAAAPAIAAQFTAPIMSMPIVPSSEPISIVRRTVGAVSIATTGISFPAGSTESKCCKQCG